MDKGVSKYLKRIIMASMSILGLLVAYPAIVSAIADPDTEPAINAVYVYEDCLEDGDVGVFVQYYLDYASTPNETATESFLGIFIDTDGATQLQAVAPYTFVDSGYGYGAFWFYFTPSEVTTYGLDIANQALYEVWLTGNPTANWTGAPPKTTTGIDYWMPSTADAAVVLFRDILYYADVLELEWSLTMIDETSIGNRLSTNGEAYFTNVITGLRLISPNCFADTTVTPVMEDIDYSTEFGATMTNGTGTVVGSPITLAEGATVVNVNGVGTFVLELAQGTTGTMTDGTGTVTGSPVTLVAGINTVTVTVVGTFTVDVNEVSTSTVIEDTIIGTGFDLTALGTAFGMSRAMVSGIVWLIVTIIICAGFYMISSHGGSGGGKVVLIAFNICILGGAILGFIDPIIAAVMFIAFGALTGYVLFFRGANV